MITIIIPEHFPGGSVGKESTCNAGDLRDMDLIPESRKSSGGGHGNPFQSSCLENPMDRGAMGLHYITLHYMVGYSSDGCKESDMTDAT